jgi:hypothetical protein
MPSSENIELLPEVVVVIVGNTVLVSGALNGAVVVGTRTGALNANAPIGTGASDGIPESSDSPDNPEMSKYAS